MPTPWTKPRPTEHLFIKTGAFQQYEVCEHCGWDAAWGKGECLPAGIEVSKLLPEPLSPNSRYAILVEKAKRWIKPSRRRD